ncbi:MAG: WD40/YVTN/BNR-like repeat-containing protein [Candidatus Limnocylindrales bacterium]
MGSGGPPTGHPWNYVLVPIKGSAAFVFSTPGGFVLSGTPLTASAADQPPIWWSTDGKTWTQATANNTTGPLGALVSATVTGTGTVYAISGSSDGMSQQLVASGDGGHTWKLVKPSADSMPYAATITYIASLTQDGKDGYLFATTAPADGAYVWISQDGGVTWTKVIDHTVGGPTGTILLQLGSSYQAGPTDVLSMGERGSGLGIWLIAISGP